MGLCRLTSLFKIKPVHILRPKFEIHEVDGASQVDRPTVDARPNVRYIKYIQYQLGAYPSIAAYFNSISIKFFMFRSKLILLEQKWRAIRAPNDLTI